MNPRSAHRNKKTDISHLAARATEMRKQGFSLAEIMEDLKIGKARLSEILYDVSNDIRSYKPGYRDCKKWDFSQDNVETRL